MILVTGSLAFDYIMDYPGSFSDNIMPDKIHKLNLSFLVNTLKKQPGGNAGNIAYSLALLKTPSAIFAPAGEDFSQYGDFLKNLGVDTSNIQIIKDKSTALAFMMTDKSDNQISAFYPGAMSEASQFSFKDLKTKPDFIVISPNDPQAIIKQADECRQLNIPFMADIGMQLPSLTDQQIKEIITGAEILIGNDYEIDLLKQKTSFSESDLLNTAPILITTLGDNGSVIKTKDQTINIGTAKPQAVIDPTGAGDAYRSGFMAGYSRKLELKVCGQMGAVAACFAIEKYGTTSHTFSTEEFKQRYFENFGEGLEL